MCADLQAGVCYVCEERIETFLQRSLYLMCLFNCYLWHGGERNFAQSLSLDNRD